MIIFFVYTTQPIDLIVYESLTPEQITSISSDITSYYTNLLPANAVPNTITLLTYDTATFPVYNLFDTLGSVIHSGDPFAFSDLRLFRSVSTQTPGFIQHRLISPRYSTPDLHSNFMLSIYRVISTRCQKL